MKGRLYIIGGPSGVGKSSLVKFAVDTIPGLSRVVSFSTRAKRAFESEGNPYHFVSTVEFLSMLERGEFVEHTEILGQFYGVRSASVKDKLESGHDIIIELDYAGFCVLKKEFPFAIGVFIMPPSVDELRARLVKRGEVDLDNRLLLGESLMEHKSAYDYCLVNHDLFVTLNELGSIIKADHSHRDNRDVSTSLPLVTSGFNVSLLAQFPIFKHILLHQFSVKKLGGWSNSSFHVAINCEDFVVREVKPASGVMVNRLHEKTNSEIAFYLGLNAEPVFFSISTGLMLARYIPNQCTLDKHRMKDHQIFPLVVGALKKLHGSSVRFLNDIDIMDKIRRLKSHVLSGGASLDKNFDTVFERVESVMQLFSTLNVVLVPCHGDTTPYNFLYTGDDIKVVDWEYSGNSDPAWDLAYLSIESEFSQAEDELMIQTYGESCLQGLRQRVILLKPVVELWMSLWAQWQLLSKNTVVNPDEFLKLSTSRLQHAQGLLGSVSFQSAFNSLGDHFKPVAMRTAIGFFDKDFSAGNIVRSRSLDQINFYRKGGVGCQSV